MCPLLAFWSLDWGRWMTVLVSKESLSSPNTVKIIEISFSWCLVRCFVCNVLIDLRLGNIDSGLKVCNVLAENIKINLYSPLKKKDLFSYLKGRATQRKEETESSILSPRQPQLQQVKGRGQESSPSAGAQAIWSSPSAFLGALPGMLGWKCSSPDSDWHVDVGCQCQQ